MVREKLFNDSKKLNSIFIENILKKVSYVIQKVTLKVIKIAQMCPRTEHIGNLQLFTSPPLSLAKKTKNWIKCTEKSKLKSLNSLP
jgi:hypothetical protein